MGSSYQHGHEYDLFLSYSTRDADWVRPFYDQLIIDINRLAKADIQPFLDKARLQPGHVWNEEILRSVGNSAILLPILSPRFFESDYCHKELNQFLSANEINANSLLSVAGTRSQIVPIKLLSAAPTGHLLARVQAQAFYEERDGVPYEFLAGSTEYRDALRKTAYAIAQTIAALSPKTRKPTVYLASDFKPHSDKLRTSLAQSYGVLPESPMDLLGLSPQESRDVITRDIELCFASVHVLSEAPFAKPLMDLQLEISKKSAKPRIAWTPLTAWPEDLAGAGFECNFLNQAAVEDRIRRIFEKPAQSRPGNNQLVYFICPDRQNKTLAQGFIQALEQLGINTFPSPVDGPAQEALQAHLKALDELDGCLIYYGEVDRAWFDATFLRLRKTIRKRNLPNAVYPAPPQTEHKTEDLRHYGITLLDQTNDAEAARAFAALLSQGTP